MVAGRVVEHAIGEGRVKRIAVSLVGAVVVAGTEQADGHGVLVDAVPTEPEARFAGVVTDPQVLEISDELARSVAERDCRHRLIQKLAIPKQKVLRVVTHLQTDRDVALGVLVAAIAVVVTVGQKAACSLMVGALVFEANTGVVYANELDVASLLDVEQPLPLGDAAVLGTTHVDGAIDVDSHRIDLRRVRHIDGVAHDGRRLVFGSFEHIAARPGNLDGSHAIRLEREHRRLHAVGHDLRLLCRNGRGWSGYERRRSSSPERHCTHEQACEGTCQDGLLHMHAPLWSRVSDVDSRALIILDA